MIGENEKGLYLADQHAAQERINYEYYKDKYAHLDLTMQPLIVPLQFEYPMSDFLILEERKALLEKVLHKNHLDVVELQEHAIATLSCKASLKANTYLSQNDMQTIFDNLMRCDNPYVCPHGRPTILFYSDYELEKLFKRVI